MSELENTEKIQKVKPVPSEDFDWSSDAKKHDSYKAEDRARMEAMYEKTMSQIGDHEVIEGTVVAKTSREVVVNIGFKSDGVIPISEFRHNPDWRTRKASTASSSFHTRRLAFSSHGTASTRPTTARRSSAASSRAVQKAA